MRKAYYAHSKGIYGTHQESRDQELIRSLGYEPILFDWKVKESIQEAKANSRDVMVNVFKPLVTSSSVLFFRSLPDGRIPAGVAAEIGYARDNGIPVLELPSGIFSRTISVVETREYLAEIGER